ncbi:hypothetical protein [Carnobacterium inhibens]|uniref:hypothetical protein n=1 Tax=Carnobacterium inhibens TaxID=147709 RepID=UPI0005524F06|nr:hypothetical protein [Carnobacterium inhibens]
MSKLQNGVTVFLTVFFSTILFDHTIEPLITNNVASFIVRVIFYVMVIYIVQFFAEKILTRKND